MDISEQFIEQTIAFSLLVIEKIIKQLERTYKEDLAYSEFYTRVFDSCLIKETL
jgi:hypothetical protein